MKRRSFLKQLGIGTGIAVTGAMTYQSLRDIPRAKLTPTKPTLPFPISSNSLYVSLHTGPPNELNPRPTEATYEGYQRVEVPRDSKHWDITFDGAVNRKPITFPECKGEDQWITHFGLFDGKRPLVFGSLTTMLNVVNHVTPEFGIGDLDITHFC